MFFERSVRAPKGGTRDLPGSAGPTRNLGCDNARLRRLVRVLGPDEFGDEVVDRRGFGL